MNQKTQLTEREKFTALEVNASYVSAPRMSRKHIGLVQLSTDHTLEMDWAKLIGEQAAVFSSRVYYSGDMRPAALDTIATGISKTAQLIATDLPMDVMAFGCTSATMVIGENRVGQLLREGRGDIPTTNPWTAAQAAFKKLGAKKIAIFSPYPSDVNFFLYQQLMKAGFEIVALTSLGIKKDTEITTISKQSMIDALDKMLINSDADLVFMSCTNLRVLDHIELFESMYKRPFVSSNSAMFWHAMALTGTNAHCPGFGRLLNAN
ncbi:Asp/Glu racemase [Psychromonas ingrahamii 37]|uniref:Asp/Glu racemase n=1 Tax=Psychromonas ingrahamii (strain DSM 17664 / CCUG 51855 / 37) TaxID=357804 RepID=A1SWC7_PSYIN|nr:Asp/Glu racemase [Psychromonas ingrahamii]ABM03792.1 Asp/Glu racemase [Psychromonas ingrahamii 37]